MRTSPGLQEEISQKQFQKSRDKAASDGLEPTTTGALLLQSLLRLHAPHNSLVLDRCVHGSDYIPLDSDFCSRSIQSLPPQELIALTHHPAASRVIDGIIDGPTIPHRSRRAVLRALEVRFAEVIDDRIGARVGARCWAAADPYLKVRVGVVAYS